MQLNLRTVTQLQDMARRSDPTLFAQLVNLYSDDCIRYVAAIERATEAKDLHQLHQAAHALRSASRTIGAQNVSRLCEQFEYLEAFLTTEEMRTLVGALRTEYKEACQALFKIDNEQSA